jgi:hypothetical protein
VSLQLCPVCGEFATQHCRLADDPIGRVDCAAIAQHVEDPAVVAVVVSPGEAGRPDQDPIGRVVDDVHDLHAVLRGQRDPVDGVRTVPGDVGESGVLIEAEVVVHVDRGDELRGACRFERRLVDRDTHEDLLCGRGVVQVARAGAVADTVDARLRRRLLDDVVGIKGHGVVGQPDARACAVRAVGEVNPPDEPGVAVGNEQHAGTKHAGSVQPLRPFAEGENDLRRHGLAWSPAVEVQPRQVRLARAPGIGKADDKYIGPGLSDTHRVALEGRNENRGNVGMGLRTANAPQLLVLHGRDEH